MSITVYNSFSSIDVEYFNLEAISDGLIPLKNSVCLSNRLKLNFYNFLESPKDFSFNRKTGMFLTDYFKESDIIENDKISTENTFDSIFSPIYNQQGLIINKNLEITNRTIAQIEDSYTFIKISDEELMVKNQDMLYLTYNKNNNVLSFEMKIIPDSENQIFEYLLGSSDIILFPKGFNRNRIIISTNPLSVSSYNGQSFFSNISSYNLGLYSYKESSIKDRKIDSFISKYDNNPIDNSISLKINDTVKNIPLESNHLIFFPYENQINGNFPMYIHALKNYQTPEYDYSNGSQGYNENSWIRRNYDQIFTGTNQYNGYDNVFLGYRGKTQKTLFKKDQKNDFFYPITAPRLSIHESGLIEDGAKSGEIPYESDKLFINKIDYKELIPTNPSLTSIDKFDGTWACTWLSGNNGGESIWLDRFYNAVYYTLDQALSSDTKVYNPRFDNLIESNVWDQISQIYLEPGVRYSYYRIGEKTLTSYVSSYDYDFNNSKGSKLLNIKKWDSDILIDQSLYQNNGVLFYNDTSNLKDDYLVMDGKNHALFSTQETLLDVSKFSVNIWLNVSDWSNIKGEQIFGNYYNSGYGLINNSSITSPTFTIIENVSGISKTFNYRMLSIGDFPIDYVENQTNKIIQKLPNFEYWVFDTTNVIGRKYDIEGKFLSITDDFLQTLINQIDQIEIDSKQNLYIADYTNKKVVKIDNEGNVISSVSYNGKSFQIDLDDQLIETYGTHSGIDSSNNVWAIVGGNLYKNNQIYGNIGIVHSMSFDVYDNLWISHGQDSISKLNTITNDFDFILRIGPKSTIPEDSCTIENLPIRYRTIDFLKTPDFNGTDVAIIVDNFDNEVYIINQNGVMISKLNLRSFIKDSNYKFYAEGDFTGYQYLRKYNSNQKSLSWKFKISKSDSSSSEFYDLNYQTSNLYKGWHLFSFVFDSSNGFAKYYIDSILVDEISFEKFVYNLKFDYKSSLLLGASHIKNKVLNDVIGIQDGYKFVGEVSDLSIYSKALTENQIRALYHTSKYAQSITNLSWNIPTGERNFIECVDQWYKMQLTGSKSKFFNLKIHNLNVTDDVKSVIEDSLRNVIKKIVPSYTELNKIEWS